MFVFGERATWRLLATRPRDRAAGASDDVSIGEVQALLDGAGLPAQAVTAAWSSRLQLDHRLASRDRADRCSWSATPPTCTPRPVARA